MANGPRCPKCKGTNHHWVTLRTSVPVDVYQCQDCGAAVAEEDWQAPLRPMRPGRCLNCGDQRKRGVCATCGLDEHEDVQVHDELRQVIHPELGFFRAAREASRQGRRLLALKLATAAAAFDEDGQGDAARAMRVWLLSSVGEANAAMDDAKAWVEETADPPAMAWASVGQQYENAGFPGSAADAYGKVLAKDPRAEEIRARRAQILWGMRREGQAAEEAYVVLARQEAAPAAVEIALGVIDKVCGQYEKQLRDDEIEHVLKQVDFHVHRSAALLTQRARLGAMAGDVAGAKRDLKLARQILPENPVYEKIEKLLQPQKTSWWRW